MATKNKTTTPILAAIRAVVTSEGAVQSAHADFHNRVAALSALGVVSADLAGKPAGKWFATVQEVIADARLSADEKAAYASADAMKPGTEKHRVANKVNAILRNIRGALDRVSVAKEADAKGAPKEGATKAGQGTARELSVRITKEIGKLYKAVTKDHRAEAPTLKCDHKELLAGFQRDLDLVK
jgi:hypothetical protein